MDGRARRGRGVVRRAGARRRAARASAIRPARSGRCRDAPGRGGRPARTSTACAAAGASTARSASPRASPSPSGCPASPCSRSPTRRARASTRRRSARARWSGGSTSPTRSRAPTTTASRSPTRCARRAPIRTRSADAPSWLPRLRGFVELHIDQTRDLERLGAPAGAVRSLASRMRLALTFTGRADHAGTTRRGRAPRRAGRRGAPDRRRRRAGRRRPGLPRHRRADARRAERVHDGARRGVRLWIDGRTPDPARLGGWRDALGARAPAGRATVAGSSSRPPRTATASRSTPTCAPRSAGCPSSSASPATTRASSPQRIPAGMVFVRNATGVSHSPEEHVELEDAAAAANALLPRAGAARMTTLRAARDGQRALARVPARPARRGRAARARGARRRRLLVLARGDVPARRPPRPGDSMRAAAGARLRRDGRRRLRRRRRVPLRAPPARRDAVRRTRTRWRSPSPRPRVAAGLRIVLLPAAYHRAGWDAPPTPGQRRFCDPDVGDATSRASTRCAPGRPAARACSVGVAAHSVRAVPAAWLEAIAAHAEQHGLVRHVHAHEQPRELEECRAEHGVSPIELLARTGFLGPRTSLDPRHPRRRPTTSRRLAEQRHDRGLLPDDRGQPRRRPLPRAASTATPACGSRSARDSNVRVDPFEETRELETLARRERRTRHALLAARTATCGASWPRNGRASLGLDDAGTIAIDRDHPDLRGVADADLAARRRDLRVGRGRCASPRRVPRPCRPAPLAGPAAAPRTPSPRRAPAAGDAGYDLRATERRVDPAGRAPAGRDGRRDRAARGRRRPRHAPLGAGDRARHHAAQRAGADRPELPRRDQGDPPQQRRAAATRSRSATGSRSCCSCPSGRRSSRWSTR